MSHLSSHCIRVFPFGSERSTYPLDRVLNEQNLTALVRATTEGSNYVCSYNNNIIEFILHGYRFIADISTLIPVEGDKTLVASITLSEEDANHYRYLEGTDNLNDEFTGVTFSNALSSELTPNQYQLQLLDSEGNVVNTSSSKYDRIYCGNATQIIN